MRITELVGSFLVLVRWRVDIRNYTKSGPPADQYQVAGLGAIEEPPSNSDRGSIGVPLYYSGPDQFVPSLHISVSTALSASSACPTIRFTSVVIGIPSVLAL